MCGYWGDPDKTAQSIDLARWMHTGDLAAMDEDGCCRIVGRLKDMVIRDGKIIFQGGIEEVLIHHPGIEAVQVIGVPDVIHDEELCAWVKPKASFCATAEEIQAFCHGQIASHKVPRYIRFVHGFPMTMTGKVKKFVMREEMMKELRFSDNTAP
jgi:fatty-acyl-CoA synthase